MAARAVGFTLDPVDPEVRTAAKRLAARLDDDSELGRVIQSILADVAGGERVVVLRATNEITPAQAAEMLGVTRQSSQTDLAEVSKDANGRAPVITPD